jgi:hypothetical protein
MLLGCFLLRGQARAGLQSLLRVHVQRLDEASGEAGPAGLVAGAKAFTVVSVEISVAVDVVPPVWIVLNSSTSPKTGHLPEASRKKMPASRRLISVATSKRFIM